MRSCLWEKMQLRKKVAKVFVLKLTCLFLLFFIFTLSFPFDFLRRYQADIDLKDDPKSFGLILDTPGCRIPKLDPYDKSVEALISPRKPYVCPGDPVFLVTLPNSTVVLDEKILETAYGVTPKDVNCSYEAIFRNSSNSDTRENTVSYGNPKPLKFGVPLGEEFLRVQCDLGSKQFSQLLPLVPIKPDIEKRALKAATGGENALNVILIGIDSVSKLNFLRHFKRTHRFLSTTMSAFDMKGYTKVGDNTFPNLVPLLTGHFIEHYWNESVRDTMFFDNLDFVWKTYADRGYRTFYAEDSPFTGTFNYLKRGFEHPPTDYYFRTMGIAIENSDLRKGYCLNNQLETEIIYHYLKDYVKTMKDRPHFAFSMVSTLTHDNFNDAGYCDEPTYNLLQDLWKSGAVNRSLVVVFSDHGIRFGKIRETYIGKIEERMPFMYLSLPKWFLEKHETVSKNLEMNTNRLITLFDVHATLRHLLNFTTTSPKGIESKVTTKGLSLLGEISECRTCEKANILPHWCSCQVYQHMRKTDEVYKVVLEILDSINMQLEPFGNVCARLELDAVMDARLAHVNDLVLRYKHHQNDVLNRHVVYGDKVNPLSDYLVTFRTTPGDAIFEGTVRHNVIQEKYTVLGISRINMYGKQSLCVDVQSLKKFCFCK